jgi:hypothetical protein
MSTYNPAACSSRRRAYFDLDGCGYGFHRGVAQGKREVRRWWIGSPRWRLISFLWGTHTRQHQWPLHSSRRSSACMAFHPPLSVIETHYLIDECAGVCPGLLSVSKEQE